MTAQRPMSQQQCLRPRWRRRRRQEMQAGPVLQAPIERCDRCDRCPSFVWRATVARCACYRHGRLPSTLLLAPLPHGSPGIAHRKLTGEHQDRCKLGDNPLVLRRCCRRCCRLAATPARVLLAWLLGRATLHRHVWSPSFIAVLVPGRCIMAAAPEQPWTEADTAAARAAIPHLRPGLVHLNNAGCSIPTQTTLAAVQDYLTR